MARGMQRFSRKRGRQEKRETRITGDVFVWDFWGRGRREDDAALGWFGEMEHSGEHASETEQHDGHEKENA